LEIFGEWLAHMQCIELGREVVPRELEKRGHKGVIVGIKNEKFVIIVKQDKKHEMVRVQDIVLRDRIYNIEEIEDGSSEFFSIDRKDEEIFGDFERYKNNLKKRIEAEVAEERLGELN
jgi:hypothetical protein